MSDRRLLISVAHPDDETFGYGGLVARYVSEGADVYAIVSTNGDVGTMDESFVERHGSKKAVRLAELDCARKLLGFRKIFLLGYRDSGMMGSESNNHPDCSWQAPREELARRVVEVIRDIRPQVILTHNRYGGYGHPDHIAIQRATTDAYDLAGDHDFHTEGQSPWRPQKLYYSSSPTLLLRFGILMTRLRGQDPRAMGRNGDVDMLAILENIEPPNARINVRQWSDLWDAASRCHASQLGGRRNRTPRWMRLLLHSHVGYTRIQPPAGHHRIDERDIFDNVTLGDPSP
ncbi:MAG: PIG-L family deacetylase [Anaerolineaceae bacterium]|nr:PIG-L family deacetylase [Anaerolineaceae bacterium]MDE0329205.1 PIG-L family deacetylase [Anaerolineaceae bacterium]